MNHGRAMRSGGRARLLVLLLLGTLLAACGTPAATSTTSLRIGVALGRGGLGDRSFNDSAFKGLKKAETELGIRFKTVAYNDDQTPLEPLQQLAGQKYDLVVALGTEYVDALSTVAAANPDQHFAIIDAQVDAPNVTSITFNELKGDFLAGALTALVSQSPTVGFLGGADVPVIRRIQYGWEQGVHYVDENRAVIAAFVGGVNDFSGFSQPEKGKELTTQLFEQGADVVYVAAGRSGLGSIDAAKAKSRLVITTGADQRWIDPVVLTTRTKNMDVAVYTVIKETLDGQLQPGTRSLDFDSGGVSLADLDSPHITGEVRNQLEEIRKDLQSGAITVKPYSP